MDLISNGNYEISLEKSDDAYNVVIIDIANITRIGSQVCNDFGKTAAIIMIIHAEIAAAIGNRF